MNYDQRYYFGGKLSNYFDYRIFRRKFLWRFILRILKKYRGNSFLDIGCAFGYLVHYAQPYFKRVVGVDVSEFAIKEAKKEFSNLEFYVADASHLPFHDEEFGVITAIDILEHTPNISASLKEIKRILKKGGILFLRMPYRGFWRKILGWHDKDLTHVSVLTTREYERIIEQNNFYIIKSRAYLTLNGGNVSFLLKKRNI